MDAHDLIRQLQAVLSLRVQTGKITLNLRNGRLESFETYVYARLKEREKVIDDKAQMSTH